MYRLNITGDNIDRINEMESVIFFGDPETQMSHFLIPAVNIMVPPTLNNFDISDFSIDRPTEEYFVPHGTFEFEEVVGCRVEVKLYDTTRGYPLSFLKGSNGELVELIQNWTSEIVPDPEKAVVEDIHIPEVYLYCLDARLHWPCGACKIWIFAKGNVWFNFEEEKAIPSSEAFKNPEKYFYSL
ncbi:hypothetical protein Mal35_27200 [Gimesia maris]|uniref:hypothetical protein n=1 Tax=Gimesia maris TaxID=122 RepID=UPI00118B3020|nr:hypothetical protein [Gimesia maris]QDT79265.1 hypothetical protein Mal35_27200 [Gimesia maris]